MMKFLERHLPSVTMAVLCTNAVALFAIYVWSVANSIKLVALLSGFGLVIAIVLTAFVVLIPDDTQSQATERTLSMAQETFNYMREGLTYKTCQATCELVLPETNAIAVAITDRAYVLGYAGEMAADYPPGSPIHTRETLNVLESGKMETFSRIHKLDDEGQADLNPFAPAVVIVPLIVRDAAVGTIKFYYRSTEDIDRTQSVIARGMGQLLSSQLNSFALDRQDELTAVAEVKALQAQINPHFLFNTINTISSFMRTDPDRARELLREFASFYRETLENSETSIPLSREIEQTQRYLKFEIARFGDDRIQVQTQIDDVCASVPVPSFLIQPVVENAVRHAMRDEGTLHIAIHAVCEGEDVLISVTDDGIGMSDQAAQDVLGENNVASTKGNESAGTGIALRNVAERIERFYGPGSGVEIVSRPDEGTSVTLRLADAVITT